MHNRKEDLNDSVTITNKSPKLYFFGIACKAWQGIPTTTNCLRISHSIPLHSIRFKIQIPKNSVSQKQ